MLVELLQKGLGVFSFLSDQVRGVCASGLAVVLLAALTYGVAQLVKGCLHWVAGTGWLNKRFPQLLKALRASRWMSAAGYTVSAVAVVHLHDFFIPQTGNLLPGFLSRGIGIYATLCFMALLVSSLEALDRLYGRNPQVPLRGVFQAGKIIIYLLAALIIISILISKNPMYVITGLSAAAAVFMLIFKDPILGFAAGIQLASNKLLKIGDWITMPSHGADGTVVDITLTTVRVQNFDNTLVNVPAYDLVSKPFQNWSGMVQSGARRIKRAINIDVDTIRFLDEKLLKRLEKIELISAYLKQKVAEVRAFNASHGSHENPLNGRHLTNIGTFRVYATAYLNSLSTIDHRQTCMVRQLAPTTAGLPLEIYCFTATTQWLKYEDIQSDIFDHLYSVMAEFDLFPFQQPAGRNVTQAAHKLLPAVKAVKAAQKTEDPPTRPEGLFSMQA